MKRLIAIILVIILVSITGCNNVSNSELTDFNTSTKQEESEKLVKKLPDDDIKATYRDFYDGSWLDLKHTAGNREGEYYFFPETWGVFGTLTINNYQSGFNTEKLGQSYDTIFIVNRITKVSETLICITEPDETEAAIPIRRTLHNNNINSINIKSFEAEKKDTNWIPTNIPVDENLVATDYIAEDNSIWVEGFKSDYPRAMITTYTPDTDFTVECVFTDNERNGYVAAPEEIINWVTFDKNLYTVEPNTYMPVWVYLNVPENIELPDKWEFWVEVSMDSGKASTGVLSVITVRIPIQVNMAQ